MDLGINGRVAVVTGGARGIGAETARVLAAEGAKLVVSDVDLAAAEVVAGEIQAQGRQATQKRPRNRKKGRRGKDAGRELIASAPRRRAPDRRRPRRARRRPRPRTGPSLAPRPGRLRPGQAGPRPDVDRSAY